MKKVFRRLLILSVSLVGLTGCSLADFFGGEVVEEVKEEDKIELRDYTDTAILNGEYTFDGKVYLLYKDESEKEVTRDCTFDYSTLDLSKEGNDSYFTVKYEGEQYIFSKKTYIKVEPLVLKGIDAVDYTDKVKAKETYTFDGKVIATYNNNSTRDVTSEANIDAVDTSKAGEKDLRIFYTEDNVVKSITKTITVTKELVSITISGYTPSYEVSSNNYTFNGSVIATYSDDSTENVTTKAQITNNVDLSTIGDYQVSASYEYEGVTKTTSVTIQVCEHTPVLQSIAASDYTAEVDKGSTYTFDGKVMATFDVGSPVDVTSACTFGSISTSSVGNKSLKISYTDPNKSTNTKSTTISIQVISRVTGISAEDSYKVGVSKNKPLNASVLPSDATNKGLTYSSSNTSVVTVNSSGTITGVAVGTASITITSQENSSITKVVPVTVETVVQDEWTILIYMCGSNLESGWDSYYNQYTSAPYLATGDLDEIKSVTGKPDDINIVVEAGGSKRWNPSYSSLINAEKLNRLHLTKTGYVLDEQITRTDMGASSTLQSFLEWGIEKYPADKMALILWNHGGGLSGCCNDEKSNGELLNNEVVQAVSGAFNNKGISKFEWVGYDCCLMQTMEVAEFNSPYFKYMVASQESEGGDGWAYDQWIDNLYAKQSTEAILTEIVDTCIEQYGGRDATGEWYQNYYYPADQTLSYLDLGQMSEFKSAWESLASATYSKITNSNKSNFKSNILEKIQHFAGDDYTYFAEFDCYDYLLKLENDSTFNPGGNYVSNAKSAFTNLVKHNEAQQEASSGAYGLSFYFGSSYNSSTYSNFTNWRSIVSKVGGYSYY